MSPALISSVLEAYSSRSHHSWTVQALKSVAFREMTWKKQVLERTGHRADIVMILVQLSSKNPSVSLPPILP